MAVVPEDVEIKRTEPKGINGTRGSELHGLAGTVVVFNAGTVHAGIVQCTEGRRIPANGFSSVDLTESVS